MTYNNYRDLFIPRLLHIFHSRHTPKEVILFSDAFDELSYVIACEDKKVRFSIQEAVYHDRYELVIQDFIKALIEVSPHSIWPRMV